MNSGIYKITNKVTGDFYIGSTTRLNRRKVEHFSHLRNKTHHNVHLVRAFHKYGEENFTYEVLELCEEAELLELEQRYLDDLKPKYNGTLIAGGRFMLGKKLTENQRESLAKYWGRPCKESTKDILRKHNTGRKGSADMRKKVAAASKENWSNPEYREKITLARKKMWESPEHRAKFASATRKTLFVENTLTGEIKEYNGIKEFCKQIGASYELYRRYKNGGSDHFLTARNLKIITQ